MTLDKWLSGGKYFDWRGNKIFYRSDETLKEPVLCLHGFPSSSYDYHKIRGKLGERFSFLSFDMLGYGFSGKPANFDYTTGSQVDILQGLIAHLRIEKLHILAHDYGNTLTQEMLARAGENRLNFSIETICFLNGALFPETNRPIIAQKLLISPLGFLFVKFFNDAVFKRSLAGIFGADTKPTEAELNDFARVFRYNGGEKIAHKLMRYMRERETYRERWVGALQKMNQPFRFIDGAADPVSGAHLIRRFREIVPRQTDIVELEKIGHYPHFEAPETVAEKYTEFRRGK